MERRGEKKKKKEKGCGLGRGACHSLKHRTAGFLMKCDTVTSAHTHSFLLLEGTKIQQMIDTLFMSPCQCDASPQISKRREEIKRSKEVGWGEGREREGGSVAASTLAFLVQCALEPIIGC